MVIEETIRPEEVFREIITDAVQLRGVLRHDMNPELSQSEIIQFCIRPLDNLKQMGLLVPGRDVPDTFEFYNNATIFFLTCRSQFE